MECIEVALKTSFRKEMVVKSTPQAVFDEFLVGNGQNVLPSDDVFVDDLLDFSNQDGFVEPETKQEDDGDDEKKREVSVSLQQQQELLENYNSDLTAELIVPADDLANLEWLSHFVEDSFSVFSVPHLTGTLTEKPNFVEETTRKPETPVTEEPCFKTPVPAKVRSKRIRAGGRVWSIGSPSLSESSSSSTSSSSSSFSSPWLIYNNPIEPISPLKNLSAKKKKRTTTEETGGGAAQPPRRCSHCGVQKTPQWRAGPLGAKTLCNACGVRFKSGRLLPEYRPACSPTFSNELHSNHHRKVLEMRRKKESSVSEPDFAPPVVRSF